jgi:hypothetical protein
MELCSLHPFDEAAIPEFVAAITGEKVAGANTNRWSAGVVVEGRRALELLEGDIDRGAFDLTYALARGIAAQHPTFAHAGVCLTTWEARVDRGVGMLMRPPARLLGEAGFDQSLARRLPIRLDLHRGMMGGAYIPARLIDDLDRQLDARLERSVRRLIEAEADAVAVMSLMLETAAYCKAERLGLYEAMDVVTADGEAPGLPSARIVLADKRRLDKAVRERLEQAAKPPKKPGLFAKLLHRGGHEATLPPDSGQAR